MRFRTNCLSALAAAAALGLAGCGDNDREAETADANLAIPPAGGPDAVIIYPAGTAASLEPGAMRAEVERLQREGGMQTTPNQTQGGAKAGDQDGTGDTGGGNTGTGSGTSGAAGGQAGGAVGFSGLDRDNDSRLSPAEYAIHALPSETPARQGATDDENPPYVSDEALNRAATSFRRLDRDGNFFLSEQEFQPDAR